MCRVCDIAKNPFPASGRTGFSHLTWSKFRGGRHQAASYQKVDGTIVDPIQPTAEYILTRPSGGAYYTNGGHSYEGPDLHPSVTVNPTLSISSNMHLYFADLAEADLHDANFTRTGFNYANLSNADLHGATLTNINFHYANLSNADLHDASLQAVGFNGANLNGANLEGADMRGMNIEYADLTDANLSGGLLLSVAMTDANLTSVNLSGSNLTTAKYWDNTNWTRAYYYTDNVPDWNPAMDQTWQDTVGILALLPGTLPPVPGDYNLDGIVDAADYTFWRDTMGEQVTPRSGADGNADGFIGLHDYGVWKTNFGETVTSGSGTAGVPEPSCLLLVLMAWPGLLARRYR